MQPAAARLVLGGAQLGMPYGISNRRGQPDLDAVLGILDRAWAAGIRTIDTAPGYGESERLVGIAIARLGLRFELITKLPANICNPDDVAQAVAISADRLGTDRLYGVLLHDPRALLGTAGNELWDALQALMGTGTVSRVGVSVYAPAELEPLLSLPGPVLVQLPANLLDQRFVSSDLVQALHRRGVEVHARSAFLQGLLLMSGLEVERHFPLVDYPKLHEAMIHISRTADQFRVPVRTLALQYVLNAAPLDRIVVGVTGVDELNQVLASAEHTLPAEIDWNAMSVADENVTDPRRWKRAA